MAIKPLAITWTWDANEQGGDREDLSDQAENYFLSNLQLTMLQKVLWTKAIFTKQCRKKNHLLCDCYQKPLCSSEWADICYICFNEKPQGMFCSLALQLNVIMSNMKHITQQGVQGQGKAIQRTALVSVKNRSKSWYNQSLAVHTNYWQRVSHLQGLQATHTQPY